MITEVYDPFRRVRRRRRRTISLLLVRLIVTVTKRGTSPTIDGVTDDGRGRAACWPDPDVIRVRSMVIEAMRCPLRSRGPHSQSLVIAVRIDGAGSLIKLLVCDPTAPAGGKARYARRVIVRLDPGRPAVRRILADAAASAGGSDDVLPVLHLVEPEGSYLASEWKAIVSSGRKNQQRRAA